MPTKASAAAVTIRMYRGLLGDFFLVSHTDGTRAFRMLIDCGVLQCIGRAEDKPSTATGKSRIIAGVEDLMHDTGGVLDLVVATHEHYDHLSGFILANDAFAELKIKKLWMAWTEDYADEFANGYRTKKDKAVQALTALTQSSALNANPGLQTVRDLLQFYGDVKPPRALGMAASRLDGEAPDRLRGNSSCRDILDWLKVRAGAENVSYLKPGQAVKWGLDDAFRAYVLGPPRDDTLLRRLDPSKKDDNETYLVEPTYLTRPEEVETMAGLADLYSDDEEVAAKARKYEQPFARGHWRRYDGADHRIADDAVVALYENEKLKDRRIETEWLDSAESLALKIDGDVNNTSLALALELPEKRMLLFPGDAQVGNWLSWGRQTYPAHDGENPPQLTIRDILPNVVFYKVGHHASHNATLKAEGLELMTHKALSVMIPLVEATAREQKTVNATEGWKMPFPKLYDRLLAMTRHRVVRGDGATDHERAAFTASGSIFKLKYGPDVAAGDPIWVELKLSL